MIGGPTRPRRVVVTGLGPVSSVGIGVSEFSASIRAGRSGIGPIRSFDTSGFEYTYAGEVPDFDPRALLERIDPAAWGRSAQFAAAAARLALRDAGLEEAHEAAVVMGTTCGESAALAELVRMRHAPEGPAGDTATASQVPASRLALAAAAELGSHGETLTLGTACSAGNYAVGYGYDLISAGETNTAVVGGADSVARYIHAGFHRLGALADTVCRPFDADRDGILTAEGGVALVLEDLDSARERGARIYAEVRGYGMTCDASHAVAPDAESIARCVQIAHARAEVKADQVDYICAHGTGTRTNDKVETEAMRAVFGPVLPPMSSIKSMLGHTMGAASGFGAVACVLGIAEGFLPPTATLAAIDSELAPLDPVAGVGRPADVRIAQNNGFAFGGNNAITVFGKVEP